MGGGQGSMTKEATRDVASARIMLRGASSLLRPGAASARLPQAAATALGVGLARGGSTCNCNCHSYNCSCVECATPATRPSPSRAAKTAVTLCAQLSLPSAVAAAAAATSTTHRRLSGRGQYARALPQAGSARGYAQVRCTAVAVQRMPSLWRTSSC
jgi:hypothetical protein